MKQLLHTACPGGRRLDAPAGSGYGVRAATAGVGPRDWTPLAPLLGCEFPPGDLERLALVEVGGRRFLLHTVRGGVDEFQRPVTHFTHALLDVPAEVGLLDCVRAWGSPGWLVPPWDGDSELPEHPGPLPGPNFREEALPAGPLAEAAAFVLSALLAADRPQVLLCATPAEVARCLFAVGLALPPALQAVVTFSTYEPTPGRAGALHVVGVWSGDERDPLQGRYHLTGRACFHLGSGRRSPSVAIHPYSAFATGELLAGRARELRRFLDRCHARGVAAAHHLFELPTSPEPLVRNADADLLSFLLAAAVTAARDGDVTALSRVVGDLLPSLGDAAVLALRRAVWRNPDLPGDLPFVAREVLLPLLSAETDPGRIADWVAVPAEDFPALLRLDLPAAWLVAAWVHRLGLGDVPDELANGLLGDAALFAAVTAAALRSGPPPAPVCEGLASVRRPRARKGLFAWLFGKGAT